MPEIAFKYYGILFGDRTSDNPAGVVRVWITPAGEQMEETFTSSLVWERSFHLSPMARPTYDEYVEIDHSVVKRFIEQVTLKVLTERDD